MRVLAALIVLVVLSGCSQGDSGGTGQQVRQATNDAVANGKAAASEVAGRVEQGVKDLRAQATVAGQELKQSEVGRDARDIVKESGASMKRALDDTATTARIKTALRADKNLMSSKISVETADGRAVLSGQLPDQAQIERAADIARRTEGVKAVENRLVLG